MAYAAAISAGVQIVQGVQGLLGGDSKDPERLQKNAAAYAAALNGDKNAALFLKQRTGEFGLVSVPGYEGGQPIGGWASPTARADAKAKWTALNTTATVQAGIASVGGKAVDLVEDATGRKIVALTPMQWALLGVAVVGLVLVVPRFFRKAA
jgi:hypothetical protein